MAIFSPGDPFTMAPTLILCVHPPYYWLFSSSRFFHLSLPFPESWVFAECTWSRIIWVLSFVPGVRTLDGFVWWTICLFVSLAIVFSGVFSNSKVQKCQYFWKGQIYTMLCVHLHLNWHIYLDLVICFICNYYRHY